MPVRFDSPRVGGASRPQLAGHQWQIDVSYRHLTADEWYVGTNVNEAAAPFGHPLYLDIHSVAFTFNYGITDRISLAVTVPVSHGSHSRYYADGTRHKVNASGIGDVSAVGTFWLWDPKRSSNGNLSLGFGVKSSSGDNAVLDNFYLPGGVVTQRPVDQAIELGDGGLGIVGQVQGYRKIVRNTYGYAQGWYLLTPRNTTHVISPYPGVPLSVPDIYSVRFGAVYDIPRARGLSVSFGPRIDGIRYRDLLGGSDGFRRPGYSLYLDPGVMFVQKHATITINFPWLIHEDFQRSRVDFQLNKLGGGDLAEHLLLAQYSFRF